MIGVAFYTFLERKLLGYIQTRKGPNKPGALGLIVPFADALKLMTKEYNQPYMINRAVYFRVAFLSLIIPMLLWGVYPTVREVLICEYSALWFVCISSVGVFAIIGAG